MMSSTAPSTTVSLAQTSKQNRSASGVTQDNRPISSRTRSTRAPFACSSAVFHDAVGDAQFVHQGMR